MSKDKIGTRIKENYEERFKFKLLRRTPVIVRIDGKAFHAWAKGFNKPFDVVLLKSMDLTMKQLCENIQGCVFGYTQSDEITLVLCDYKKLNSCAWFDNEIQKICSVSASMATAYFDRNFSDEALRFYQLLCMNAGQEDFPSLKSEYNIDSYDKAVGIYEKYSDNFKNPAMFDARCFNVPREEVTNTIIWRQWDAIRNSIEMVGRCYFSHKELENKNTFDIQNMLLEQHNVNWNDFPVRYKRGCACHKKISDGEKKESSWILDYDMPIITHNMDYVEKWIQQEEE